MRVILTAKQVNSVSKLCTTGLLDLMRFHGDTHEQKLNSVTAVRCFVHLRKIAILDTQKLLLTFTVSCDIFRVCSTH